VRPVQPAAALIASAAGIVTFVVRLAMHERSFDLFGDEVIYTDLGRSVISGGFPRFDGPFFLHGPGFFYLEAGWARIDGYPLSLMGWVYEMRSLNCVLAGATAVVLVLLTTRATRSPWAGAAAGALFALEPFCIRQNDRVLLETAMMFWVVLGYLVFTSLIGRLPARRDWLRAVGAGLFFGFAVLTKDEGVLLTVLPLLAAAVLRWGPRLRMTMLTIATTVAVYAAYLAVVRENGYFSILWQGKTAGIQRMLGLVQSSGFNSGSSSGGSLSSRLIAEISYFGTTYTILAVAAIAVLVLLFRGDQLQRMLGLLYCAAGVTLAYAVFLGTLEEQELYLLVIPSLVVIPVAATLLLSGSPRAHRSQPRSSPKKLWIATMGAALSIALGVNLLTCVRWVLQPDDGFAQLISYVTDNVPAGTAIGSVYADIETLYGLPGYQVGYWETKAALAKAHARYFVVEWAAVEQGYSNQTPASVQRTVSGDRVVFSFTGRTYGNLVLYQLPG
jgi:hypothetical protein